jgi:hypothetical protein
MPQARCSQAGVMRWVAHSNESNVCTAPPGVHLDLHVVVVSAHLAARHRISHSPDVLGVIAGDVPGQTSAGQIAFARGPAGYPSRGGTTPGTRQLEQAMLSSHEQQQLTEIERQFTASDPVLADLLRNGPNALNARRRRIGMFTLYVLGALLLLLGFIAAVFSLIFFGLVALMTAAGVHVTRSRRAQDQ